MSERIVIPVVLRNGTEAAVTGSCDCGVFRLAGICRNGMKEIWQDGGEWTEDGAHHPLDITSVSTADGFIPMRKGTIKL